MYKYKQTHTFVYEYKHTQKWMAQLQEEKARVTAERVTRMDRDLREREERLSLETERLTRDKEEREHREREKVCVVLRATF
jgi:hypothetical protein